MNDCLKINQPDNAKVLFLKTQQICEQHHEKTCLCHMRTTTGADQPAHPCILVSTFAVCWVDTRIPVLAKFKI